MGIGRRKSGSCIYLYGTKQKLCTSALRNYIQIKQRRINSPKLGSLEPLETFNTVASLYSAMIPRQATARFNGVNVEEGTTTHLFYVRYDDDLFWLDRNSLFIDYEGYGATKTRRFKLLSIQVLDEANEWMVINASARGDASLEATEC